MFVFPASYAQQRLWFLDRFEAPGAQYNVSTAIRLQGHLNIEVVQKAMAAIVERHEILRTTFALLEGVPMQMVAPSLVLPFLQTDISHFPEAEREAEAYRITREEARKPFDLTTGPLIRMALTRLAEDEFTFVVVVHHIIADGWSVGILIREFTALYTAFVQGEPSPLPELEIQYGDYAHWQRELLTEEILQRQQAYWSKQLEGTPALLTLPTDRPRPPIQGNQGKCEFFDIPPAVANGLHALCKRKRITLFTVLNAAYAILLSRYAGQDDVCIGTVVANRDRPELEALIGIVLNTLVLRLHVDGRRSFDDMLKLTRETILDAYSHQDLPFERLTDLQAAQRDSSYSPFFQTMLILQNAPLTGVALPGVRGRIDDAERAVSIYDLSLNVIERNGNMFAYLEYKTELFDDATIRRMSQHFIQLLEAVAADSSTSIDALPMLGKDERRQLLDEWSGADGSADNSVSSDGTIATLFEDQAARTPDATALLFGDDSMCYRELNERSNRLAHQLQMRGVGPDSLVGICAERDPSMVIGLLAVLKAGGAYLPLDPAYPEERLAMMLDDAKPMLLLCQSTVKERLPQHDIPTIMLDLGLHESISDDADQSSRNPQRRTVADNLAYAIYSSGSTGKPKGVMVAHRQVINRFRWLWEREPFDSTAVGCHKTSINFVDSLWEIFGYLLQGVPTVLIPNDVLHDHTQLISVLARHKVSHFWLVPSLLKTLLEYQPDLQHSLPHLKLWSPGGEALTDDLLAQFRKVLPQAQLLNLYGLSESWDVAYASYLPTPEREKTEQVESAERAVIGRPLVNTALYILDAALQPVPIGVTGELYVAGVGLARGYLNNPMLTAEKFIPNPYHKEGGGRLYKTGDLARYLADGNIEYLGRVDNQVKIRGFRIELGEIEATLGAVEGIRESVVIAIGDDDGDKRLVAYVIWQQGAQMESAQLRKRLQQTLPDYMIPAHFVTLERLPLTPNGKLNRFALPVPEGKRSEERYEAPTNELEQALADIWAEVLKLDKVGIHDNFFVLGGHSLSAMQVLYRIKAIFYVELAPRLLFDEPTIATTAALVEALIVQKIENMSEEEAILLASQSG
jgi:amino acid adenylation domain-containing protein